MHGVLVVFCLLMAGALLITYPLLNLSLGLDIYTAIVVLFAIAIAVLEHAGVRVSKSAELVRTILRGSKK
ncbi:MAG: hypothetical protein HY393_02470 [Candidatus Diapherotrites archaeon]|nr:hypothetical protein [Candidatus Diapherotrites archaeon]